MLGCDEDGDGGVSYSAAMDIFGDKGDRAEATADGHGSGQWPHQSKSPIMGPSHSSLAREL